ncbi:MAG: hypothetical protein V2J12_06020 [Gammaproteobacteria bacterium]|jgi:hypothetical protein|nr:hypothetical protein [Gammaproteobacteria bacterium]
MKTFTQGWALLLVLASTGATSAEQAKIRTEAMPASHNVFWSGHSLTDPPIPQMLTAISAGFGVPMQWNRHSMAGASMEARTRGRPPVPDSWDGYRQGNNRDTTGMDVIAELRTGATIGGEHYDTLIITEVHSFLYSLLRGDTVRLLRHYHDRFIDGNAAGQTWFYQSWLDVIDKSDPQSWIDYETAAAPVWQCIATRVNLSLAAAGRPDRIAFLPASLALVQLVELATGSTGVEGITAADNEATLNRIFRDKVHLTDTGAYFIGLVTYAFTTGASTVSAWAPDDMDTKQARRLQQIAWDFYLSFRETNRPLSMADCSALIRDSFAVQFWEFELARQLTFDIPWYEKAKKRVTNPGRIARNTKIWRQAFAEDNPDNPFNYDATTDADYWHPAP